VRLTGGLGNQMFQYAAARAISIRVAAPLELDLSWFATNSDREFALAPFNIEGKLIGGDGRRADKEEKKTKRVFAKFRYRFHLLSFFGREYKQISFEYDPRFESLAAPIFLKGYFQSDRYFSAVSEVLRKDFTLTKKAESLTEQMEKAIESIDGICIHVRRGDYIHNPKVNSQTGICSIDYYQRGLELVAKNLSNPHCFVFSDEPQWTRDNLQLELPMTVVDIHDANQAHEDLRLMMACKNFLIANSSFSWWAAWLGRYPNKTVVAPAIWFKSGGKNTKDLIPDHWQTI
jgi:hypothetical protein